MVAHCKRLLAGYKVPREVRFERSQDSTADPEFALRKRARGQS